MRIFERAKTLPLGVDIGSDIVSIVCSATSGSAGFSVRETRTLDVPASDASHMDLKIAETIRAIISDLTTKERRCVLAVPSTDVVTRIFRVPRGMRRGEADRAAMLQADTMVDWPLSERLVALDPIPGQTDDMLLSVARSSTVERLVGIARAGGLRPVAVDVPACAWRRAIPDGDAILDCTHDRAELVIFGSPAGTSQVFPPRLVDERLATAVRNAFVEARRDGIADVARLVILGTRFRYESMEALLRDDGYALAPAIVAHNEGAPWTFAFGLASWSVAPLGVVAS